MKLVRIAKARWEVTAVVDPEGRCPVLDLLDRSRLLGICLRVYMPLEGPPTSSAHLCRPLGDGIFELGGPRGTGTKIFFFDDEGSRIVCAAAPEAASDSRLLPALRASKLEYHRLKRSQGLQLLEPLCSFYTL